MRPDLARTVPIYNPGLTAMTNLEIVINGVNSLVEAAGYVACPEPGLACCPYKERQPRCISSVQVSDGLRICAMHDVDLTYVATAIRSLATLNHIAQVLLSEGIN